MSVKVHVPSSFLAGVWKAPAMQNMRYTTANLVVPLGQAVPCPMSCCSSASQHLGDI